MSWRQDAQCLHREARVFYFAFKHPRVRWHARIVAGCTVAYILSPVQLIPSFIPVIGFMDDFLVVFLGVRLLRKIIPQDVLAECRAQAVAAELKSKVEPRSRAALVGLVAVVSLWFLLAIGASAVMMTYIHR